MSFNLAYYFPDHVRPREKETRELAGDQSLPTQPQATDRLLRSPQRTGRLTQIDGVPD